MPSSPALLRDLTGRGVRLKIMHGNRRLLIASGSCARPGRSFSRIDPRRDQWGQHSFDAWGYLCTDDVDYQSWRATARSSAWQQQFLALPVAERRSAILALREKSKAVIQAKPAAIMDVNGDAVREALRRHGVSRLVHGHTHRPGRHAVQVDARRCERLVLPDWYGRRRLPGNRRRRAAAGPFLSVGERQVERKGTALSRVA